MDTPAGRIAFGRRSRFTSRMEHVVPCLSRKVRLALMTGASVVRLRAEEELAFLDAAELAVAIVGMWPESRRE